MTEEKNITQENAEIGTKENTSEIYVPKWGIALLALYLIVLGILIMFGLFSLWPPNTANDLISSEVIILGYSFEISYEMRLILLVAMAGALGSLVHAFRSFFWYVGNREFVKSWILMYILLPLVGSFLSLIFYFVIRGGLFSNQASIEATNPFGFAGLAGLVGMFSNQAALKLQEIAETMFSTKESTVGKDHVSSKQPISKEDVETTPEAKE